VCLNGNIISNPIVTDTKVFVTTIIGTFRRKSLKLAVIYENSEREMRNRPGERD